MSWSRRVIQSYLVAKKIPEIKAIVAITSLTDARKPLVWRPAMLKVYQAREPDFEKNKTAELSNRSIVDWLEQLPNSPIVQIHDTDDKQVHVEQYTYFAKLLAEKIIVTNW